MNSDITRQISASVYTNSSLRTKIYEFVKDPYHAVVDSSGINTKELLKHVFNARNQEKLYLQRLFIPAVIFLDYSIDILHWDSIWKFYLKHNPTTGFYPLIHHGI